MPAALASLFSIHVTCHSIGTLAHPRRCSDDDVALSNSSNGSVAHLPSLLFLCVASTTCNSDRPGMPKLDMGRGSPSASLRGKPSQFLGKLAFPASLAISDAEYNVYCSSMPAANHATTSGVCRRPWLIASQLL
jgi:hypothetical protein